MITQRAVNESAKQWGLDAHIIEQDYVLGWLLWGIAKHPTLSRTWVLKGGSAIKKCYVDTHRYSQDLDFTILPPASWSSDELSDHFIKILEHVSQVSGVDFTCRNPKFEARPHGEAYEGTVYYVGPRGDKNPASVKLDISHAEDLMRPPALRTISHPYGDAFPDDAQIYCYSLEELFAEKIRALKERARPRDLYDIIYLFRRSDLHAEPELINEVLEYKCEFKGISVPLLADIQNQDYRQEIETRWKPMLGRAVGQLPDLDDYWYELPNFFAWLTGEEHDTELLPITDGEVWRPVPLLWQYGQNDLLEPIRYAAVNHLMVNLGYGGKWRLVEPYSLRLSHSGSVLFYAIKAEARQIRSYRMDRIQSIEVSHQPFKPVFRIEFTPEGRIPIPFTQRRRRFSSRHGTGRTSHHYVIECAICGKHFYRDRYSTRLNPHKRKDSHIRCSGRYGFLA